MNWQIITCEYPPQVGGVSDYTLLLTQKLQEAGDDIRVYAPALAAAPMEESYIHRSLGSFSNADFHRTSALLDKHQHPRNLFVQWVPHGYGRRSMNIAFCRWIASRARTGDRVYLMVHEPFLEFGHGWKQNAVAFVHRRMVRTLLRAATRVFISIPAWKSYLEPYAPPSLPVDWLPVPASVSVSGNVSATSAIRAGIGHDAIILGHLGTYSAALVRIVQPALEHVLRGSTNVRALLIGNRNDVFARNFRSQAPDLAARIHAPGLLQDDALSHHIAACDLMLQPYPDGITSRRTSLMNVLSHGVPTVSNTGHLTEPLWCESNAVALASRPDPSELASLCGKFTRDHASRQQLSQAGLALYRSRFDWPNVIATLRGLADSNGAATSTSSNRSHLQSRLE